MRSIIIFVVLVIPYLLAMANAASCSMSSLITKVHLISTTKNVNGAGTKDRPNFCLKLDHGWECKRLPEQPDKGGIKSSKSHWWAMDHWPGYRVCDVDYIKLQAVGGDDWQIKNLIVLIEDNIGRAFVALNEQNTNKRLFRSAVDEEQEEEVGKFKNDYSAKFRQRDLDYVPLKTVHRTRSAGPELVFAVDNQYTTKMPGKGSTKNVKASEIIVLTKSTYAGHRQLNHPLVHFLSKNVEYKALVPTVQGTEEEVGQYTVIHTDTNGRSGYQTHGGGGQSRAPDEPKIVIDVKPLPQNNPSGKLHYVDFWRLNGNHIPGFRNMAVNRIDNIWMTIKERTPFEWKLEYVAIIMITPDGYYVPVIQKNVLEVTKNEDKDKILPLKMLSGWNNSFLNFDGDSIARGGFWKYVTAIDPWETKEISEETNFYTEDGKVQEESYMEGYENAYEKGGSFSLCASAGIEIKIIDLGVETCVEENWSTSKSSSWEREASTAVSNTVGRGMSHSKTSSWACPAATNTKIKDMQEIYDTQSKCWLYQWYTFVYDAQSGNRAVLATYEYDIIEKQGNVPRCVPSQCMDHTDCQKCYEGPRSTEPQNKMKDECPNKAVLDGYFHGDLVQMLTDQTMQKCRQACCKNKRCKLWVFRESDKVCHLKKDDEPNFVKDSGHKSGLKIPYLNGYYHGDNIAKISGSTAEKCRRSCSIHTQCKLWVYRGWDESCHLKKDDDPNFVSDSGHKTAFKEPNVTAQESVGSSETQIWSMHWEYFVFATLLIGGSYFYAMKKGKGDVSAYEENYRGLVELENKA